MKYYMFVGTYTIANSNGIYIYEFDSEAGKLKLLNTQDNVKNPSYLTIHGDNLYVISETKWDEVGQIYVYHFDRRGGTLKFLNKLSSRGDAPCYVGVDRNGDFAVVAKYASGSLILFSTGTQGEMKDVIQFIGHSGSSNINKERQKGPHVHQTVFSPDGKYLLSPDLGQDAVTIYEFNKQSLSPLRFYSEIKCNPGSGPRHITFSQDGNSAYIINELSATISVFLYKIGRFEKIQEMNTWNGNLMELKTAQK